MTMTLHEPRGARRHSLVSSPFLSFWTALESAFVRRPRSRVTDLRKLDDHLLRDIGLTRADVDRLAGEELPRDPLETVRMRI